jgi:hypothetical protein
MTLTLMPAVPRAQPRRFRLWLPVPAVLLWLLFAPVSLVALAALAIARQPRGIGPFAVLGGAWRVLFALAGTTVEVDCPDALIRIRIF